MTRSIFALLVVSGCSAAPAPAVAPSSPPAAAATEPTADAPADEPASESVAADEIQTRARTAYVDKDWPNCASLYDQALQGSSHVNDAYNGACCHALAGDPDGAFADLSRAAELGYRNLTHAQADTDLGSLHELSQWGEFLAAVEANQAAYLATINAELYEIYTADQGDRRPGPEGIDWSVVSKRDEQRHSRVLEIIAAGEAEAAADWFHAAMVMQHGNGPEDYRRAHEWALQAAELDPTMGAARWLAAASKDRELMKLGEPQLYGTQFIKTDDRWELYEVDESITDEERAKWNVPPLAAAKARAKQMNDR